MNSQPVKLLASGGCPLVLQFIDPSVFSRYPALFFSPRFTEKLTRDKESLNRLYNSAILMPRSLTAQKHNNSYF